MKLYPGVIRTFHVQEGDTITLITGVLDSTYNSADPYAMLHIMMDNGLSKFIKSKDLVKTTTPDLDEEAKFLLGTLSAQVAKKYDLMAKFNKIHLQQIKNGKDVNESTYLLREKAGIYIKDDVKALAQAQHLEWYDLTLDDTIRIYHKSLPIAYNHDEDPLPFVDFASVDGMIYNVLAILPGADMDAYNQFIDTYAPTALICDGIKVTHEADFEDNMILVSTIYHIPAIANREAVDAIFAHIEELNAAPVARKAVNIAWDTDDEDVDLPTEIDIPAEVDDEDVADYLSDQTGFCHFGFQIAHA